MEWNVESLFVDRFLQYCIRERTSRFLEQSAILGCPSRLRNYLALIASTCHFLVQTFKTDPSALSQLPEFLVDNIVEVVGYLRRLNDDFIEVYMSAIFLIVEALVNGVGIWQTLRL